jgi:hypothetical protein
VQKQKDLLARIATTLRSQKSTFAIGGETDEEVTIRFDSEVSDDIRKIDFPLDDAFGEDRRRITWLSKNKAKKEVAMAYVAVSHDLLRAESY